MQSEFRGQRYCPEGSCRREGTLALRRARGRRSRHDEIGRLKGRQRVQRHRAKRAALEDCGQVPAASSGGGSPPPRSGSDVTDAGAGVASDVVHMSWAGSTRAREEEPPEADVHLAARTPSFFSSLEQLLAHARRGLPVRCALTGHLGARLVGVLCGGDQRVRRWDRQRGLLPDSERCPSA